MYVYKKNHFICRYPYALRQFTVKDENDFMLIFFCSLQARTHETTTKKK